MPTLEVVFAVLLSLFICTLALLGLGSLVEAFLGSDARPLEAVLMGLGLTLPALELYHLFRPVDWIVSATLALAGLIGLAIRSAHLRQFLKNRVGRHKQLVVALSALSLLIGVRSAGACEHFDTGLYGIQAVRWLTAYRAVPGLADFYERLGFNNSFFLLVACFKATIFGSLAYRLWQGVFLIVILSLLLRSMKAVLYAERNWASDWFLVLLSIPIIFYVCRGDLVGTNTDLPADFTCILGAFFFLRDIEAAADPEHRRENTLFAACIAFSLAVVFKLSTIVFAGPCCLVCFVKLLRLQRTSGFSRKGVWVCFALVGSMLLGWISLGYIQSGYPFFPAAALSLPVDWRVPRSSVQLQAAVTKSFARIRNVSRSKTAGWAWLHPWFAEVRHDRVEFLIPTLIIVFGILFLIFARKESEKSLRNLWPLLLPCFASIVFWFLSAPALRFAQGEIWVLTGTIGSVVLTVLSKKTRAARNMVLTLVILALAGLAVGPTTLWSQFYDPLFGAHSYALFPQAPTITMDTQSGLKIIVPASGQQCWDAPLPCTPYFSPNIQLRQAPSLKSGFRPTEMIEAQWLPVN